MQTNDERLETKGVTIAFANPTPRGVAWQCADHADPEIFDPVDSEALVAAQAVCGGCAVRTLCLQLGTSRDEWGVWGGVLLENGKQIDQVRQRGRPKKVTAA